MTQDVSGGPPVLGVFDMPPSATSAGWFHRSVGVGERGTELLKKAEVENVL